VLKAAGDVEKDQRTREHPVLSKTLRTQAKRMREAEVLRGRLRATEDANQFRLIGRGNNGAQGNREQIRKVIQTQHGGHDEMAHIRQELLVRDIVMGMKNLRERGFAPPVIGFIAA